VTVVATQGQARSISKERVSLLIARALHTTPDELDAGFRAANIDDLPALLDLRRRVIGSALVWNDAQYMRWRYLPENGALGLATCWVCTRGGELLGMIGTEALRLMAGESCHEVHATMDLMVQPELAGSGLGVWINQTVCERLGTVLAIGSNPNSKGVLARSFEALPDRRTYTHPLHFSHFMAKRMSSPLMARCASVLADLAMQWVRTGHFWLARFKVSVEPVTHMEQGSAVQVDIACLLQSARQAHRVEVLRDTATLSHRLLENPRTCCELWLARRSGRPVGLIATRIVPLDDSRYAVQVLDAVINGVHLRIALRALLAQIAGRAYRRGAEYVSWTLYDPSLEAEIKRLMFRMQPHPYETLSWVCPDAVFREAVLARAAWTLSDIHTDRDSA
jgi:hypothetical protein